MAVDAETHTRLLSALAPPGQALPEDRDSRWQLLLSGLALALAKADARMDDLVDEADPRSTFELLADWERVAGLPDDCTGAAETLQERRAALVERLTAAGGQSIAYFEAVAESLGYTIEVEEFRPFTCGRDRCGDPLGGGHEVRHVWRVAVPGARLTYFRAGASQAGDLLGALARAEDLECRLRQLKPAHSELVFSYEGV